MWQIFHHHLPGHKKVLVVAVITEGVDQPQELDLQGNLGGTLAARVVA